MPRDVCPILHSIDDFWPPLPPLPAELCPLEMNAKIENARAPNKRNNYDALYKLPKAKPAVAPIANVTPTLLQRMYAEHKCCDTTIEVQASVRRNASEQKHKFAGGR